MNKSMTVMVAAAILLSSSAYAQTVDTKDDCNKSVDLWGTAYNNRDAEALANLYDAKAGMYSGPFWTATGHDAIVAGFKAEFKAGMNFGATITSRVCDYSSMTGATTVSDGTWTATMKGPDGKDVLDPGSLDVSGRNTRWEERHSRPRFKRADAPAPGNEVGNWQGVGVIASLPPLHVRVGPNLRGCRADARGVATP